MTKRITRDRKPRAPPVKPLTPSQIAAKRREASDELDYRTFWWGAPLNKPYYRPESEQWKAKTESATFSTTYLSIPKFSEL